MHWRVKALIQVVLALVPCGRAVHYGLQRTVGGMRQVPRELASKVDDSRIMGSHLRDAGVPLQGSRMLEIGTGWYPTLPFAFYLAGAASVTTFDLNRHMRPGLTRRCAELLGDHLTTIAGYSGAPLDEVRDRHARLVRRLRATDVAAATDGVVRYHAPADATRTGLPDASVDVVFSNSVLEHVPPDVIDGLYRESRRVLVDGGVMFHSVNCGDHYAYVDRRISQLNYLQYSDDEWRRWNNEFLYQNRLRAAEFLERARAVGFEIVLDTSRPLPQRLAQLSKIRVHSQFAGIPAEQLCITSVDFIGRRPPREAPPAPPRVA